MTNKDINYKNITKLLKRLHEIAVKSAVDPDIKLKLSGASKEMISVSAKFNFDDLKETIANYTKKLFETYSGPQKLDR